MIAKVFGLLLSLSFLGIVCSLLAAPTVVEPPNLTPFTYLYHFQDKGFDAQGHGAFAGKATKVTTLQDGSVIYDGKVVINPKRADTVILVLAGPEIVLANGKKVGQLRFSSFRMAFDTGNETFIYRNGVMTIADGTGHSLQVYNEVP